MLKKTLTYFALLLLALGESSGNPAPQLPAKNPDGQSGTLERMIIAHGTVALELDLNRLKGIGFTTQESLTDTFRFDLGPNSFFTIRVFNKVLRGPEQGSMELIPENFRSLPEPLDVSTNQLVVEKIQSDKPFDLVIRDGKTGFVFFNVERHLYEYDADTQLLGIRGGRLLVSGELASKLGRPADEGAVVGGISINASMEPIEITTIVKGTAQSSILPPRAGRAPNAPGGFAPGPDIIVGDLPSMAQFGAGGSQVGLGVGTTSCNNGDVEVDWFSLPSTDHCVIPQNLYRMSGGANNDERFEQIGQSWMKHAFFALQDNECGFGCIPAKTGEHLGVGCSDPYDAGLNADQDSLGSRAWVNPFTGAFPTTAANHTAHSHTGTSHRVIVESADLNMSMNPGATYFAEAQYVTPHEYAWCQTHPGQCNMYNNASYRRFNVSGTTSFTFSPVGSTQRMTPAINAAWPGATLRTIEPAPGVDGRAFLAYKVTNSGGIWHYEYAIYNQNLDRGIQSFSVPLPTPLPFLSGLIKRDLTKSPDPATQSSSGPTGDTYSNPGFHAPPQHPGFPADGTTGDAGFSNADWTFNGSSFNPTWESETFAQNPNANAIRWGTLYNFRFDSTRPPQAGIATIGFFKTGLPITVAIQVPSPSGGIPPTPTPPQITPTPTPTPPPETPTPTPTPTPGGTPAAQALNLSTRMQVQSGDNVGIGGFIITGTGPKHVLLRAIGPSLTKSGVPDALADPVLELHDAGVVTATNNNWRDDPAQEALILASGIAPSDDLESAIDATLDPGAYTAIVRGNENTSGVALVEIYDLDDAVSVSKLANISTRAFVGAGSDILIAGFMLGNANGTDTVMIRGLGPSLSAWGIATVLANPMLELRNSDGALLISNEDWQDNVEQAAEITAAGLAPGSDLDSAMVATLSPGLYTALLAGTNNGTGIGLVEVYDRGGP